MKKQLIHIHGGTSWPSEGAYLESLRTKKVWEPFASLAPEKSWSSSYLESFGEDWEVMKPNMPYADNAEYQAWKIWFERYIEYMRDDIVLVGHSLGGTFLVKYLSENILPVRVRQLHIVAGAYKDGDYGEVVFKIDNDLSNISQQCKEVYVYHSRDDKIVPYEEGEWFAERIAGAKLITFIDRGHFLQSEFPELIANILGHD